MEQEKTIPYYAHEGIVARMERSNRRLWILCIVLIILLAVTNGAWIWYESQFVDEVTITQENDDGYNNYIGNDGDSDFAKAIRGKSQKAVLGVVDELMTTLQVMHPRLYSGVMARI